MTKNEYQEITQRTLAMDSDEVDAVLDNVPDHNLLRQVIHRYGKLLDYVSAIEGAQHNHERSYRKTFDEVRA